MYEISIERRSTKMAVEVNYGAHSEAADLEGQTVGEVREQYQMVFNIPDSSQVTLNGQPLARENERDTKLKDNDRLDFNYVPPKGRG